MRDRLDPGQRPSRSLGKKAHIPCEDGAHPGRGLAGCAASVVLPGGNMSLCKENDGKM